MMLLKIFTRNLEYLLSLSKEESILSRETSQVAFFFFRIMPYFSTKTFNPLSTTPQPRVDIRMRCSCLSLEESFLHFQQSEHFKKHFMNEPKAELARQKNVKYTIYVFKS